ncbi:MAG: hypothetical protein KDC34_02825 [Saprospiraceae bacterium]|nr:hypothetical protein [Saprospiraceae bacterium]
MKNFKFFFIAAILAFSSVISLSAKAITTMEVKAVGQGKMIYVSVQTKGSGTVNITISDKQNHVLFTEVLDDQATTFEKLFNLNSLESGNYTLNIEDEFKTIIQPFRVAKSSIEINTDIRTEDFKPLILFNSEKENIDINWLLNAQKDFKVVISDERNNTVYKEIVENTWNVHKRYDISNFPAGYYKLMVTDGDSTYYEMINIK